MVIPDHFWSPPGHVFEFSWSFCVYQWDVIWELDVLGCRIYQFLPLAWLVKVYQRRTRQGQYDLHQMEAYSLLGNHKRNV